MPSKDQERPLTESGKMEIEKISESLGDLGTKFDRIVTSPLKRAQDTAIIVSEKYKEDAKLEVFEELRPDGNRAELIRKLSKFRPDSNVMIVGHEPYLSTLIGELISEGQSTPKPRILLKKGGLAKVEIKSFSPRISAELRWLLTPRLIKRMS